MREIRRVLKPDGWAKLLVPITADRTFEDPSVTDPLERLRLFGQEDHVRGYGRDYLDRLKDAGFSVKVVKPADFIHKDDAKRMGISQAEEIFHCKRNSA